MNCLQLCNASNAVREAISRRRPVPLTGVGHQGAKGCTEEHESSSWPGLSPAPELGMCRMWKCRESWPCPRVRGDPDCNIRVCFRALPNTS